MKLRAIALIILISMLVTVFAGCGNKYLGKYYSETDESVFIELKADNVLIVNRGDMVMEGTYEINGESITLTLMGMKSWGKFFGNIIVDPNGDFWRKK
ncbi:MAG: hypothetical protein GX027_08270 [Clostridiaceae bacterium]|jgi:uncharacterized lipoprotein YehR (DUF1307 family)|nr:hypothetical protein [Clostridiaceae bacterium]